MVSRRYISVIIICYYSRVSQFDMISILLLLITIKVRGDIKLFDFGLSQFCPEGEGDPNLDVFEMSGAGTPRYEHKYL